MRVASIKGKLHAHGCAECGRRCEDACYTPTLDPVCFTCRSGLPPAKWDANRLPVECCFTRSRPCTPQDRATYKLAGVRTWHICRTCSRTFPNPPVRTPA